MSHGGSGRAKNEFCNITKQCVHCLVVTYLLCWQDSLHTFGWKIITYSYKKLYAITTCSLKSRWNWSELICLLTKSLLVNRELKNQFWKLRMFFVYNQFKIVTSLLWFDEGYITRDTFGTQMGWGFRQRLLTINSHLPGNMLLKHLKFAVYEIAPRETFLLHYDPW